MPTSERSDAELGTALRSALSSCEGVAVTLCSKTYLEDEIVHRVAEMLSRMAGRNVAVELRVNPTMDAGAILYLGGDHRVTLDARATWLAGIERELDAAGEEELTGAPEDTYGLLHRLLETTSPSVSVEELSESGTVLEVGDGVAFVAGLRRVGSQELVEFPGGVLGIAFSLLEDKVGCLLLGPEEGISEGSDVRRTGHLLRVPAGETLLGRVVNSLGDPIDGKRPITARAYLPAERKAPGVVERQPVTTSLHTGIKALDALVPLGRGQRELIIGDRRVGKTTIAIDTILAQRGTGVCCIYAAIGQKASSVARVVSILEEHGAMEYTTVVVAFPNEQPAFRYLAPYTACAMGEYYMEAGRDALVVFDDLSKHAVTYREVSALLGRPIGREAYPGDIFYVHSRLLERAARLSDERRGGSLTALPIVETLAGDISAFIPTNVISICDGQIMLSADLFNEGSRPAMEVGLSVSRVGGSAQTRAMKQVAGRLRVDLAQYEEMAQFVKFGAEVDEATVRQLARGERARELLKQAQHAPMSAEVEVLVLYAVGRGVFDAVPVDGIAEAERRLVEYVSKDHPGILAELGESGSLSPEITERLDSALASFATEPQHAT
ncbi:MAG: F0F1 ATP synthase subunit alpha [Coriobacteriia bacterium]